MNFGYAVEALKAGNCVARSGWNGKNMFLQLVKGTTNLVGESLIGGVSADLFEEGQSDDFSVDADAPRSVYPHILMLAANGMIVNGWLASQTDILAEDWEVVLHYESAQTV